MASGRIHMSATTTPLWWAESLLQLVVSSGDLLEEYRDTIHPARGPRRADRWYVAQVLGFAWRSNSLWAALFAAAFLARTALDWLVPPADFYLRSLVTTCLAVGILLCAGFSASWRAGSIRAGAFAGIVSTAIGAPISLIGASMLLAIWHDPGTMAAVEGSGGLGEVFVLPWIGIVAGALVGAVGGAVGAAASRLRPR
jgi:hypothetical protein